MSIVAQNRTPKLCSPGARPRFYDLAYNVFDIRQECNELLRLAARYGVRDPRQVLDLGCGPGHHLRELAGRNIAARGIDNDAHMLSYARHLAKQDHISVYLKLADMRCLRLRRKMDLVLCLGASFNSITNSAEAVAVFRSIAPVLRSRGLFQIEFHHPPAVYHDEKPVRWRVHYDIGDVECRFVMKRLAGSELLFRSDVIVDVHFRNGQRPQRAVFRTQARPWFRSQMAEIADSSGAFKLVAWRVSRKSAQPPRVLAVFRKH